LKLGVLLDHHHLLFYVPTDFGSEAVAFVVAYTRIVAGSGPAESAINPSVFGSFTLLVVIVQLLLLK
jgi:hypothetical protein